MLLTLTITQATPIRALTREGLLDMPRVVREQFGLHGINISTSLLKGADRSALVKLRDAADRAGCACLVLVEPPLALAADRRDRRTKAFDRCARLIEAASCLGCNSLAIGIEGKADDQSFETAIESLREISSLAEDRDLNVLLAPTDGLTEDPERVTEIIKRVGGFRIGTYPDFETAAAQEDPIAYLRRLVPYAWAVSASTLEFVDLGEEIDLPEADPEGEEDELELPAAPPPEHVPFDLFGMVEAVSSVGYDGTLSIDYRGEDVTLGIRQSCEALTAALARLAGS